MTNPIPGPWTVDDQDDILGPDGTLLAATYPSCQNMEYSLHDTAVLIASAPDQREVIAALAAALAEIERLASQEVRTDMAADTRTAPPWAPTVLLEIRQAARAALELALE